MQRKRYVVFACDNKSKCINEEENTYKQTRKRNAQSKYLLFHEWMLLKNRVENICTKNERTYVHLTSLIIDCPNLMFQFVNDSITRMIRKSDSFACMHHQTNCILIPFDHNAFTKRKCNRQNNEHLIEIKQ